MQRAKRTNAVAKYLALLEEKPDVIKALLQGPLAHDLLEVGISLDDVRHVMKGGRLKATDVDAKMVKLHYSNDGVARRRPGYRVFLDGPGYADQDALSQFLGTVITVSTMGGAVWWLTSDPPAEKTIFDGRGLDVRHVVLSLVFGSAVIMMLTGRVRQLVQALYVTTLTAVLCTPLCFIGPIFSW